MPRSNSRPPDQTDIQQLTEVIGELGQHVQVLYEAIDGLRDDLAAAFEAEYPFTSFVSGRASTSPPAPSSPQQKSLWSDDGDSDVEANQESAWDSDPGQDAT